MKRREAVGAMAMAALTAAFKWTPAEAERAATLARDAIAATTPFAPAFSLVEGWRGAIIHWVMAGTGGALERVKVFDPSFLNWPALSYALINNIVPDFPLCNKSFNQSYAGNDL